MNQEDIIKCLKEPFTAKEIKWKIQTTTKDNTRALVVAYMNSHAIQKRLDDTVGVFGWQNVYQPWQEKSQICGLSIYCEERNEWITKYDSAENTDYEPIKGELDDAFKRAASFWGIGRYLHEIDGVWVDVDPKEEGFAIKQDQYGKLEAEYNKAIAEIFNTSVPQTDNLVTTNQQPTDPPINTEEQTSTPINIDYKVQSIKPSGKASSLLELVDNSGEIVAAYIKNGDKTFVVGTCLQKVELVQKDSSYGKYNLINSYELVA